MRTILLFAICCLFSSICEAQITQEWVRRYPDTNSFTAGANALALDDSGNIYITGLAIINNIYNYATIKYNSDGKQKWVSIFSGISTGGRIPYAIALDDSTNVYVSGSTGSTSMGHYKFCTIKYSNSGDSLWVRVYTFETTSGQKSMAMDSNSNVYVTSWVADTATSNFSSYGTIKYDSSGILKWAIAYGI